MAKYVDYIKVLNEPGALDTLGKAIDHCIKNNPYEALKLFSPYMTKEQMDVCIDNTNSNAPSLALVNDSIALFFMDDAQINRIVMRFPIVALRYLGAYLTSKQLQRAVESLTSRMSSPQKEDLIFLNDEQKEILMTKYHVSNSYRYLQRRGELYARKRKRRGTV